MAEVPEPRRARPRREEGAADVGTLVDLGWVDPPPEPAPLPPTDGLEA
ncbi:hypothetical protein [Streptomyces sp. DH12]|nr:hypothetical protein [Streptomyces sp. DH12]